MDMIPDGFRSLGLVPSSRIPILDFEFLILDSVPISPKITHEHCVYYIFYYPYTRAITGF